MLCIFMRSCVRETDWCIYGSLFNEGRWQMSSEHPTVLHLSMIQCVHAPADDVFKFNETLVPRTCPNVAKCAALLTASSCWLLQCGRGAKRQFCEQLLTIMAGWRCQHSARSSRGWLSWQQPSPAGDAEAACKPKASAAAEEVSSVSQLNPLKGSGVRWLHFEVFSAIQV